MAGRTVITAVVLLVIAAWVLLFGMLGYATVLRGRRQERKRAQPGPTVTPDPNLTAVLAQARQADPHFDERLLLDAAQLICLVVVAAISTGDEEAVRYLAARSFWGTFSAATSAARRVLSGCNAFRNRGGGPVPVATARLPLDYQALAPELTSLDLRQQRAAVRVSFSQLRAVVAPGTPGQAAMASATSLSSLATSFGGAMSSRLSNAVAGLSWVSWAGQYELVFTRPARAAAR